MKLSLGAPQASRSTLIAAARRRSKNIVRSIADLPDVPQRLNPRLIFDIGMHVGQDTDFYLRKGFDVVAAEANPLLAAAAERRFRKALRARRLRILNVGVGDRRGRADFHVNLELSEWSSFKPATASRGMPTATIEVDMVTIGDLVRKYGVPYYLKIDIEGLDGAVIHGLRETAVKPQFLSFENGAPALFELLVSYGYSSFKFINQAEAPMFRCPNPAREGLSIAFEFPYGASGPFGEDTPGEWIAAGAMREILARHAAHRASGHYDAARDGWFDLHGKL